MVLILYRSIYIGHATHSLCHIPSTPWLRTKGSRSYAWSSGHLSRLGMVSGLQGFPLHDWWITLNTSNLFCGAAMTQAWIPFLLFFFPMPRCIHIHCVDFVKPKPVATMKYISLSSGLSCILPTMACHTSSCAYAGNLRRDQSASGIERAKEARATGAMMGFNGVRMFGWLHAQAIQTLR